MAWSATMMSGAFSGSRNTCSSPAPFSTVPPPASFRGRSRTRSSRGRRPSRTTSVSTRGSGTGSAERGNNVKYYLRGNLGYATNKIVTLNEARNLPDYQKRLGRTTAPSSACFGYIAAGIIRTQADLDALPAGYTINGVPARLGMLNYEDLRGPRITQPDGTV